MKRKEIAVSNFSKRIKALRLEYNLSLRQLEKLTNISHSSLSAYENERREPSFESLEALADVFNCDIDYILCRTDVRNAAAQERGAASLWEAYNLSSIPEIDLQLFANGEKYEALTEAESEILKLFRMIPEEKQRDFLEMGRLFANSLKKD
jgi:transcriptional regulator with XRE-family HTH domain